MTLTISKSMDFKQELQLLLEKHIKQPINLEAPPSPEMGDFALHTYKLKIAPNKLQQEFKIPGFIEKTEIKGPYLNFFLKKSTQAETILKEILKNIKFKPTNTKYIVEFSQPNTHKAFHVGHIRGTSIGESTARILDFTGNKVIRANYMGDTGAHVAKWLWCYQKFHKNEKLPKYEPERWIADIYVESGKKIESNPEFQEEVDRVYSDLENKKSKYLQELWKKSRQWSLKEFEKIYKDLNTHFDVYYFEGQVEEEGQKIAMKMQKDGLAHIDDEALVIDLKEYNLGIFLLLRKNGTCLYSIKDIALAYKKLEDYKFDKSLYIIGAAQSLYVQQVFKTLEILNYPKDVYHIAFSEVRLPEGKMSSRTGQNILYLDMKKQLFDAAREEVIKRHKDWTTKKIELITKQIAIAAIKFSMLSQDSNKVIVFDSQKALEFEGETGPYIQYTHARACSILKKAKLPTKINYQEFTEPQELALINHLSTFKHAVEQASEQYKPSLVAHYAIELCQKFNEFYHSCPVLTADSKEKQKARLILVKSTQLIVNRSLNLLGIDAPIEM